MKRGLLAGVLTLLVAVPAMASSDILIKIAEIPGKISRSGVTNGVAATGISLGISGTTADGSTGKPTFAPLTFTKLVDSTTPQLMEAAGDQRVLKNFQIHLVRPTGTATVKTVVTIPNAVVTDWRLADGLGSEAAVEQVTLRVDGFTLTQDDVDASGKTSTTTGTVP